MKVSGRCYCGQISFEAEIEPDKVRVCHCTDCQTLSGSAFRANVPVVQGTFVLQTGEPKTFFKSADSGNRIVHAFCPDCGHPDLFGRSGRATRLFAASRHPGSPHRTCSLAADLVALGVAVDHRSESARGGAAGPAIGLLLSWRRPERRSLVYPDHRIQHPYHRAEEGAVPAARGAARQQPRHPLGGRVCVYSRGREREFFRGPRLRAIRLRRCDVHSKPALTVS
jgi:hypothetical protein